ncbi:hypothetical protein GCM10022221_82260 [Actinocorallia aurea]
MAGLLGDKRRFAVEIGDRDGSALRRVDLWVADQWLTCDDNMVFVKSFRHYVARTAAGLRRGDIAAEPFAGVSPVAAHRRLLAGTGDGDEECERFGFFGRWGWGPTTDNVMSFLWRDEDCVVITAEFWRESHLLTHPDHAGSVFAATLPATEFAEILDETLAALGGGP